MGNKSEDWYKKQIQGLYLILDDAGDQEVMISRNYVKEKLKMILENGINFHPAIEEKLT